MRLGKLAAVLSLSAISGVAFANTPQGWHLSPSYGGAYTVSIDQSEAVEGQTRATLSSDTSNKRAFGSLTQAISAGSFKGKRVRLSARVKTEDADHAFLWLRADRADGRVVAFDNMDRRPVRGNTDWTQQSIVLDLPDNAHFLAFGVGLNGAGKVHVDDFTIEPVSQDVPVTERRRVMVEKPPMRSALINAAPVNLGFEHSD